MDIKSLNDSIKRNELDELFDLIKPSFIYRTDIELASFEVEQHHEMRIDLIFQEMYKLEPNQVGLYLENIDIILFINFIDNPLNIKKDLVLFYPKRIDDLSSFRMGDDPFEISNRNIERLVLPNKSSRKDPNRKKYLEEELRLSPVIRKTPKNPVELKNGVFNIGGL